MNREKLQWVARNGAQTSHAVRIGTIALDLIRKYQPPRTPLERTVQQIMNEITDPLFTAHCSLGRTTNGIVSILVDRPELVAPLRMRWTPQIMERLRRANSASGIQQVLFQFDGTATT